MRRTGFASQPSSTKWSLLGTPFNMGDTDEEFSANEFESLIVTIIQKVHYHHAAKILQLIQIMAFLEVWTSVWVRASERSGVYASQLKIEIKTHGKRTVLLKT